MFLADKTYSTNRDLKGEIQMENLKKEIAEHRTLASIIVLGFIVFINCFGFPIYNFGKTWSLVITVEYLLIPVLACGYIGGGLALLFPQKRYFFMLALLLLLICVGMVCRFLLEFGEVSNTYNFILPNILFHIFIFGVLSSLSWLHFKKYN